MCKLNYVHYFVEKVIQPYSAHILFIELKKKKNLKPPNSQKKKKKHNCPQYTHRNNKIVVVSHLRHRGYSRRHYILANDAHRG